MKKNSFSNNKNKRNKTPSLVKQSNINKTSNESKNEIPIIDLLKCPICKNICLMNINRDKLLFSFECNNNHNNRLKKSQTYINSGQNYLNNISDINFKSEKESLKIKNKDNNTSNTNPSYDSTKLNGTRKNYITENDFSCTKHPHSKYKSYCLECKENICEECSKEHPNHNTILLNSIKPKENEVISYKNEIIKKEEELNNIIEKMMKWKKEFEIGLNTIIKIMQNISNLKQFIIMNYDIRQSNQNYNYIQNFNNMKVTNFIFPELVEFFKEKNWKRKGHILIEVIINIQKKINENKEKLKIMKLKEEIDRKTKILKEKIEQQENNIILKSKKKEINTEENNDMDMDSIATAQSNKKRNFNTTYSSDCMNNNYFCRNVSRKVVNSRHTKKKIIEKRNRNNNDNTLTHTIEQNKELENKLNNENVKKNEDNPFNQKIKIETKMIKVVEPRNNNCSNKDNRSEKNEESETINKINYNIDDSNHKNNIIKNIIDSNNIEDNNIKKELNYCDNNEDKNEQNIQNEQNDINIENNENNDENENNLDKNEDKDKNELIQQNEQNEINFENNEQNENNLDNNEEISKNEKISEKINNKIENNIESSIKSEKVKSEHENIQILRNKRNKERNTYKNIELKYELINTDIIRSIEFLNNNHILICTLENITIYKLNQNYELIKVCDIKEFNYRINYSVQLSNGNLVICSLNDIDIIQFSEKDESLSYTLIQKINGKNDSNNINKVIEIKEKNLLISCDKKNIIQFSKNNETNLYEELNFINTNSEVKCIEKINENLFVAVEPEEQCVIFYEIDNMKNNNVINNIQSSFGRYAISYNEQNECIFVTGSQGIYLISTETFQLITFFKVGEWISSINYDYYSEYLICGTWKKNSINEQKIYNLILFEINEDKSNIENNPLNNMNIKEVERKENIHYHDIVVIKASEEGFILTGSNDRTVKLWK